MRRLFEMDRDPRAYFRSLFQNKSSALNGVGVLETDERLRIFHGVMVRVQLLLLGVSCRTLVGKDMNGGRDE